MTFLKKNILISAIIIAIIITLSACDKIPFLNNNEKSSSEEDVLIESNSSVASNEGDSFSEKITDIDNTILIEDTMGSASFSYDEKYEMYENEGIKYIYFNEKDFFIAESSGKIYDEQKMTEENAKQVFLAIEESYNQASGDWSNGKKEGNVEETTIAGYNGWSAKFNMDYQGKTNYTSKVILTYVDGEIMTFSVLSEATTFEISEKIFNQIISTINIT